MLPSSTNISGIYDFNVTGYQYYTAPANGYVQVYFVVGDSGLPADLFLKNTTTDLGISFPRRNNSECYVPCKKGDEIRIYSSSAGNTEYSYAKFIYAEV